MKQAKFLLLMTSLLFYGHALADFQSILKKAEKGDAQAQYIVGTMYQLGKGVPEDDDAAFKWTRLSAMQGDAEAQNNLGYMYDMGEGVVENDLRSYMWRYIAAEQGELDAIEHRDQLAKWLSKEKLAKAQAMVTDCKKSQYKNCE